MSRIDALLPDVIAIAERAGRAILEVYHGEFEVEHKADDSPLTAADLAAHRVIAAGLRDLTPDWPQLSEEGADIDAATRHVWSRYWLIDPLDGTKEFVKRNGQFTVNIALIEDSVPVLGVVHAPELDCTWSAAPRAGAAKRAADGSQRTLSVATVDPARPRVLVSSSHRTPDVDALLTRMPDFEPVAMGSSLKFCLIAEGEADFYPRLGPTSEWDTGAAHAVLAAAGGEVVELSGTPLRYNQRDSLLNPHFLAFGDTGHDWRQYLD
ncbi:3'(2'),5'-bisphosphate nucleotidase CysQ [Salinisphaera sp. P385]|uniref:3'(2'),5'-bisphosphate nucleotidase CysQ n=1 Tax=Spectribacter acetivorans TaxID=3075603 RepID=A0ABU3B659_9GAMM|nr:3'(2'),5'-bisphosphate nucleotidase CysQ [Salinisphaera sp. P385]MDT0617937.1 3'(2'),5'-bisphosphate nucleotidase CysQ [Salinisphaera sp. P385]